MPRVNLLDFGGNKQQGLWISGPRERTPATHMRRLTAVNNQREREIRSRNGSTADASIAAAHSLSRFNNVRFQGATTFLYRAGVQIDSGYDGTPLEFEISEPRVGTDAEFLFVCGGGKLTKVDTSGTVTQWGITAPADVEWGAAPGGNNELSSSTTNNAPQTDAIATTTSTDSWTSSAGAVSLDTTDVPTTSGSAVCVTVTTSTGDPEEPAEAPE